MRKSFQNTYKSNGWPNEQQSLLLQALFSSNLTARDAWKKWAGQVHFDAIDPASYKLLALVVYNSALSFPNCPIFNKCQGIYRRTWMENQLLWKNTLPTFEKLLQQGVKKIVLLKGMAMILTYYKNFGLRVMGDIDILIAREEVVQVDALLRSFGWAPLALPGLDIHNSKHLDRWHAMHFEHPDGMHLDVHWSLLEENASCIDQVVLEEAVFLPIESVPLHTPPAEALFLQSCLHGIKKSPVPLIRWIADAIVLVREQGDRMDWDKLIYLARRGKVTFPLSLALQYLTEHFALPIPSSIHKKLQGSPTIHLERAEYWNHSRGYANVASWYRFCLNHGYLSLACRIGKIPQFIQTTARLRSKRLVPVFMIYWICKRGYRVFLRLLSSLSLSSSTAHIS